jgi:nucleoside-diphosphate-sugar epimerase
VVEACIAADAPLCTFSSAEVYGRSGLLHETDDIIVPPRYNVRLEYAIAKTLTEAITANARHRGLRGFVIRPFNVAGRGQSRAGGFVMPTFVQQALAGRPLTVFASGHQVRAFLAVTDLARSSSTTSTRPSPPTT